MHLKFLRTAAISAVLLALSAPAFALSEDERSALARSVDYIADHGVSVVQSTDGGSLVILQTAFDDDVTADLRVVLGNGGMFAPEADLGQLAQITGLQVLKAPATVDVNQFDELHVLDRETNSLIGVAPLR